jgi:predicted DCC family thiol-disulfide oxidoreductase YuxK
MTTILLFDGTCGFCARSVQFVLDRERRQRTLRFASLESPTGKAIRRRHPELADVDSVVWVESAETPQEHTYVRSAAALSVLRYLGGPWSALAALGAFVPRVIRDPVYDLIARHRHELGAESCIVPSPEQRARFLDWESPASVSG